VDILVKIIKILLVLIISMVMVGCNLPVDSQLTPSLVVTEATQDKLEVPTEAYLTQTYPPESPLQTIRPTIATITSLPTKQGIQPNNVFGITLYTLDEAGGLTRAAQAGTGWTRNGFIWNEIEPSPGDRLWNLILEESLIRIEELGVEPVMLIEGTPDWALKAGFSCGAVADSKFDALGQFAYDLVQRYSAPPYNIHYWELWNEPDAAGTLGCWGDPSDTQYYGGYYYGQMLQVVYPRMKAADPKAQVLVGGLLLDCDPEHPPEGKNCLPSRFLNGVLESGAGPYFDGVAFHAYDYYYGEGVYGNGNWNTSSSTTGPVSITKANYIRRVLSDYGYGEKYLINTETALFWGPNVMNPPCEATVEELPSIELTMVNYVIQSYAVAVAEGWKANIWYSAFGVRCSGLLNSDLSPKAGYYAYQFAEQKLSGAQFVRQISEYEGVMGYEYETPGGMMWVIWSMDGKARTLNLEGLALKVNRVGEDGQAMKVVSSLSLTIEGSPLFIETVR
jgi:hypothetical protein